ncbi:glycosylated lysosomal membrane protein B-like [Mizuhopecten yessoensis]|uniref:Lysosomal protein NCU-G1-B n=1 Tax=Mizuhopecten yessoensis TaxID=6573 RepID=A0A210R721_MIZYE|nr:glycosylated lysosomal membrane protein B-like [Mizuhopecten yessoensis]OWF56738.1 Lysosomal protein NCU-G1-B [Mizuhopecten yessoensis]
MATTREFGHVVSVLACISFAILSNGYTPKRQLNTYLNPDCSEDCGGGLAYVKARGDADTLHFVFTTVGTPTALVIRTNTLTDREHDKLKFNWDKLRSNDTTGAISTPNPLTKVLYSYGIMFTRLFQYNDTSDAADLSHYTQPSSQLTVFDFLSDVTMWENLLDTSSDELIALKIQQTDSNLPTVIVNGSLTIQFHLFDHGDRADYLPHLEYNEDTTHFDFILQDIDNGNMSSARYGVETIFFSEDSDKGDMSIELTKSIDDEYSPGVFSINNLVSRPAEKAEGGFLQWKPICYMKAARARSVGTAVKKYGPQTLTAVDKTSNDFVKNSIAYAFYGADKTVDVKMSYSNFSFGLSKDGFFTKNNYTAWSGSLGYGLPPADKVSSLVVGVISAGLGLPVVLMVFGGVYVVVKKKLRKTASPSFSENLIN